MARRTISKEPVLPLFEILFENSFRIKGELYPGLAPNTVGHFIHLANSGFYDGSEICLISPGRVLLIDQPENELSYGIKAECELNGCAYNKGVVCTGSLCHFHATHYDSGNSGFFIVLAGDSRTLRMLQGAYAMFGQVLEGMYLADKFSDTKIGDKGVPMVRHVVKHIRVDTRGKDYPFETCPIPESTIHQVILGDESDSALSFETDIENS